MNFNKNNQPSSCSTSGAPRASTDSADGEIKLIHIHSDDKRRFDLKVITENGIRKVGIETWRYIYDQQMWTADLVGFYLPLGKWNEFSHKFRVAFNEIDDYRRGVIQLPPPKTERRDPDSKFKTIFSRTFYKEPTCNFSAKVLSVEGNEYAGIQMWQQVPLAKKWTLGLRGFFLSLPDWVGFWETFDCQELLALEMAKPPVPLPQKQTPEVIHSGGIIRGQPWVSDDDSDICGMYSAYFNRPNICPSLGKEAVEKGTVKGQQQNQIPVVIGKGIGVPKLKLTLPVKRALESPASPPKSKRRNIEMNTQLKPIPVVTSYGTVLSNYKPSEPAIRTLTSPPVSPRKGLLVESHNFSALSSKAAAIQFNDENETAVCGGEPLRLRVLESKPVQNEFYPDPLFYPSQQLSPCSGDKVCILLALGASLGWLN
jgi:hypothetical protein